MEYISISKKVWNGTKKVAKGIGYTGGLVIAIGFGALLGAYYMATLSTTEREYMAYEIGYLHGRNKAIIFNCRDNTPINFENNLESKIIKYQN